MATRSGWSRSAKNGQKMNSIRNHACANIENSRTLLIRRRLNGGNNASSHKLRFTAAAAAAVAVACFLSRLRFQPFSRFALFPFPFNANVNQILCTFNIIIECTFSLFFSIYYYISRCTLHAVLTLIAATMRRAVIPFA